MIDGNYENKYETKNPVSRYLMENFLSTLKSLLPKEKIRQIAEVGAGEGVLVKMLFEHYPKAKIWVSDISPKMVGIAKKALANKKAVLTVENLQHLSYKNKQFDLIICCEVMEHVENPEQAIKELYRVCGRYAIVSVPNEPLWRILNMIRGKYLGSLGNTPGHLNHWSSKGIVKVAKSAGFKVISIRQPLPWTMLLLKV